MWVRCMGDVGPATKTKQQEREGCGGQRRGSESAIKRRYKLREESG